MDQNNEFLKLNGVNNFTIFDYNGRAITAVHQHEITPTQILIDDHFLTLLENNMKKSHLDPHTGDEIAMMEIDAIYERLSFLTRSLVLLASQRLPNNVWHPETQEELAAGKEEFLTNKRRERIGRPPLLPLTPIMIDLTRLPSVTTKAGLKEIRELLGITSVRATSFNWRGRLVHRRAHDRRIPSAVDRRDAVRAITAKTPATLKMQPERPKLVIGQLPPVPSVQD